MEYTKPRLQAATILGQRSNQGNFCTLCRGVDHSRAQCALSCLQPQNTPTVDPPDAGQEHHRMCVSLGTKVTVSSQANAATCTLVPPASKHIRQGIAQRRLTPLYISCAKVPRGSDPRPLDSQLFDLFSPYPPRVADSTVYPHFLSHNLMHLARNRLVVLNWHRICIHMLVTYIPGGTFTGLQPVLLLYPAPTILQVCQARWLSLPCANIVNGL